ncbi:MAG: lytic transglycosylase domain-containing protein [Pseudomonadota bacterium]
MAASTGSATANNADLCQRAAARAAATHAVPVDLMQAISRVETRRPGSGASWPWTLNIEGEGHWFETRRAALKAAQNAVARGQTSVDLGCFQVNFRWHGEHFRGLDGMLDPAGSADYAARFLRQLFAETGNWLAAVGLYHSRTEHHSARYRGLVEAALRAAPQRMTMAAASMSPGSLFALRAAAKAAAQGSLWRAEREAIAILRAPAGPIIAAQQPKLGAARSHAPSISGASQTPAGANRSPAAPGGLGLGALGGPRPGLIAAGS